MHVVHFRIYSYACQHDLEQQQYHAGGNGAAESIAAAVEDRVPNRRQSTMFFKMSTVSQALFLSRSSDDPLLNLL